MDNEYLVLNLDQQTFEKLITGMRRDMFGAGACYGACLGVLIGIGAYVLVGLLVAAGVVWVTMGGWPWTYKG